jgi:type IV fimbrial biogenesis protein FimT
MNNRIAIVLDHASNTCPKRHDMTAAHAKQGFTLIELLVTLSIATILLTIAVPSFIDFIRNSRLSSQTNDFVLALMSAKSEAVKRGQSVVVCSSANGTSCAGSTSWEQGWIVYQDADNDGVVDAPEIMQVRGVLEGSDTLRTGTRTSLTFQNTGFSAGSNATFTLCAPGTVNGRGIVLSLQGRVTTTTVNTCPP